MRLLYLNYGPQSGVTASVANSLSGAGVEVVHANPTERFLWQLRPGSRIPNLRPAPVRAFLEALRAHGSGWKAYWLHTVFAFDHLSDLAGEAIRRARPDAVLQAGVLFGPGPVPRPRPPRGRCVVRARKPRLPEISQIRRAYRRAGGIGRCHLYVPAGRAPSAGPPRVTTLGDPPRVIVGAPAR